MSDRRENAGPHVIPDETVMRRIMAEGITRDMVAGLASWERPPREGAASREAPFNPVSGREYGGINAFWLESQWRSDPRWMTARQAKAEGGQVREGERGTPVEYWQWTERHPEQGADGKPMQGEDGRPVYRTVELDRPKVMYATLYNAEQIDGLPALAADGKRALLPAERSRQGLDQLGDMLADSGVRFEMGGRAGYDLGRDVILMPGEFSYGSREERYASGLHQLCRATGHSSRLARDMSDGHGSRNRAAEDLRVSMAAQMVASRLGIQHHPQHTKAQADGWHELVRNDPHALFRATRDAEVIATWIMEPEKRPELERVTQMRGEAMRIEREDRERNAPLLVKAGRALATALRPERLPEERLDVDVEYVMARHRWNDFEEQADAQARVAQQRQRPAAPASDGQEVPAASEKPMETRGTVPEPAGTAAIKAEPVQERSETKEQAMEQAQKKPRTYLTVPFAEKDEAKAAGARWDRREKAWYAPEDAEAEKLARWAKKGVAQATAPELDPRAEFAEALKANGLVLKDAPVMDGKWHRAQVEGDKGKEQNGSYRGFVDGVPNGHIVNFKTGGENVKWRATGNRPADLDRDKLKAESQERAAEREKELSLQHKATAKRAYGIYTNAKEAAPDHPYLARKGVEAHELKQDDKGNLLVPLRDTKGFLWNVQSISPDGEKRFLKEGRKDGLMHGMAKDKLDLKQAKTIIIAEGYATAASLHSATGIPAIVAFDASNLKAVAEEVRRVNPKADIAIAADDDHKLESHPVIKKNVGREKAEAAAQAVGGRTISPPLNQAEKDKGLSDFNDLEASRGKKEFAGIVGDLLEKGRPMQRQKASGRSQSAELAM